MVSHVTQNSLYTLKALLLV